MCSLIIHGRCPIVVLQKKWRNLSVSVKLQQNSFAFSNSFSSASVANVGPRDSLKGQNFAAFYLVDSLGLTSKLAESISRKVSFEEKGNPDSVLKLLRSYGFTDSQISSMITIYPRLLMLDAEKSLGPKLKFLQSRGVSSTSELTQIVSTVPKILGRKGNESISRYYDLVKEILRDEEEEEEEADSMVSAQGGRKENQIGNVSALRGLGVPQRFLFTLLNSHIIQPLYGKEEFEESLKKVVEMGFDPTSSRFVEALRVIYLYKNETLEEKVNVYKSLGFAEVDVWAMFKKWPVILTYSEKKIAQKFETLKKCGLLEDEVLSVFKKFPQSIGVSEQNIVNSIETFIGLGFSRDEFAMMVKRHPQCIGYSAESVKKKTEFMVKKMNWPIKSLVSNPQVLSYSMEKRIVPRCNVIEALISKGLLEGNELPPLTSVLVFTDQVFLKKYVMKHGELVPELMAIFTMKE